MHERIHRLEHIRQLNAINTMVGTAQANTQTAGMFGKGSEEHGQTIPAVLVRMVRTSGLLRRRIQSRNVSHLIIIRIPICRASAAATGWWADVRRIMALSRWQRLVESSAFSQNRELRHSVMKMKSLILTTMLSALKDEHLKVEMTALSHTSFLRVTPEQDELVHLVINPNSDEGQGYIEIDTINHIVYGYNPVHRIYRGWGNRLVSPDISSWLTMRRTWWITVFSRAVGRW